MRRIPGLHTASGSATLAKGWVRWFIQYPWGDPRVARGHGAEWVAIDAEGNLYGGAPYPRNIQKYVRVMP